jgi:tol-pal system protein YbgF
MRRRLWIVSLVASALSGCAHHATPVESVKLRERLEELAQREADRQKQVEELNNRLFLLEDKVDTSRVAIERSAKAPRLPVVRLRPRSEERTDEEGAGKLVARDDAEGEGDDEGGGEAAEAEGGSAGGKSIVERKAVRFSGLAGKDGPRPVLKLHESSGGGGASAGPSLPLPGPDPSAVKEKLPVVPIPRARAAARGEPGPDVAPMREYNAAMAKYRSGELATAAEAFRSFFQRYGKHAYADNALYWLAESTYDLKQYRVALKLFRQVVEEYPNGNKAPDALLKMAYCYLKLREEKTARTVLAQVVESFPKSEVARLASQALAKIQ